jgi:hypothetical protein
MCARILFFFFFFLTREMKYSVKNNGNVVLQHNKTYNVGVGGDRANSMRDDGAAFRLLLRAGTRSHLGSGLVSVV